MGNNISSKSPDSEEKKKYNQENHRSGNRRRKGLGFLAFYLAGGPEQRYQPDRRTPENNPDAGLNFSKEKRIREDRRKVVHTKYLNCGKCIDIRKIARRSSEKIDITAVERKKYKLLGPGWL